MKFGHRGRKKGGTTALGAVQCKAPGAIGVLGWVLQFFYILRDGLLRMGNIHDTETGSRAMSAWQPRSAPPRQTCAELRPPSVRGTLSRTWTTGVVRRCRPEGTPEAPGRLSM